MADFSALIQRIKDAVYENGVQAITGQILQDCLKDVVNTVNVAKQDGIYRITVTVDPTTGTPSGSARMDEDTYTLELSFSGLKGETGPQGPQGPKGDTGETGPAGVSSAQVSVAPTTGTPSATASVSDGVLTIHFSGLKGETGPQGVQGVQGAQGPQGNTGSSVDYPYELVNNLTTDDATKGLSAAQGVVLDGKVSQLEAKVTDLVTVTGLTTGSTNLFDASTAQNAGLMKSGSNFIATDVQSYIIPVLPNTTVTVDQKTTGNRFVIYSSEQLPANGVPAVQTVSNNSAQSLAITLGANEHYILIYVNSVDNPLVDVSNLRVYYGTEWDSTPKTTLLSKSEAEQIITPIATQVATNTANINTEKFRNGATIEGDTIVDYPVLFKSGETWNFKNLLSSGYQVALFQTADKDPDGRLVIPLLANDGYTVTLNANYVVFSTYSTLEKKFTISGSDASVNGDEPVWTDKNIPSVPYKVFDSLIDPVTVGLVAPNGGIDDTDNNYRKSDYIPVKPSHKYRLTISGFICAYDSAKNVISGGGYSGNGSTVDVDYTTLATCAYVRLSARCSGNYVANAGYFKFYDMNPDYLLPSDFLHWKPLNGKRVVVFADSIAGLYRAGWPLMLQEKTGALVYNCGFPGCRMELLNGQDAAGTNPFAMCSIVDSILSGDWSAQEASPLYSSSQWVAASLALLKTIDFTEVDIVLIAFGINELGYPQDDSQNPINKYTYAGATRYSLNTLMGAYKQLGVCLLAPTYCYNVDGSGQDTDTYQHPTYGGKLTDNVETLKDVAEEYKVPFINMYYEMGINKVNKEVYYVDGTHLNYDGLQRYSGLVAQGVEKFQ